MQLIYTVLLLLSLIMLVGAVLFVCLWHHASRKSAIVQMLHEGIGHIGVSAIVEYPETPAPLFALLEEHYPRSEAVIITDLQHYLSPFGELVRQFSLVRVDHSHLAGVRALYRSCHRAFKRVVMVDLPVENRHSASAVGEAVATYDYILRLQGESIVASNAIAYCANIIASQSMVKGISLRSIVGAEAQLERSERSGDDDGVHLRANRALAWRKERRIFSTLAVVAPAAMVAVAHLSGSRVALFAAVVTAVALALFIYISCCVVAEKSLFATLDTILRSFYRFLVERVKHFHYLYKERVSRSPIFAKGLAISDRRRKNNRKSL